MTIVEFNLLRLGGVDSSCKTCQNSLRKPKKNIVEFSHLGSLHEKQVRGNHILRCGNILKDGDQYQPNSGYGIAIINCFKVDFMMNSDQFSELLTHY